MVSLYVELVEKPFLVVYKAMVMTQASVRLHSSSGPTRGEVVPKCMRMFAKVLLRKQLFALHKPGDWHAEGLCTRKINTWKINDYYFGIARVREACISV